MKKIIVFLVLIIICLPCKVYAKTYSNVGHPNLPVLRAGGGGSSGGGGGSSGGSSSGTHGTSSSPRNSNPIMYLINQIWFLILVFLSSIVFYIKVLRQSRNSKKYLKLLKKDDPVWNYKEIEKQVVEAYYVIQNAWKNNDMEVAKDYMTKELLDNFKTKLGWMEIRNEKNILKRIKLINLKPVSLYDDEDDTKDKIWFYIKGNMIDYTIDLTTREKKDGNSFPTSFVEFWLFQRNEENKWVLAKIYQKEEFGRIN